MVRLNRRPPKSVREKGRAIRQIVSLVTTDGKDGTFGHFMWTKLRGLFVLAAALAGCAGPDVSRDRKEIQDVLARQAEAWNRGDLEAFLVGYWRSDQTVFAGGDKVHRGFEAMARRYREAY